jgi:hypothetical protein
MRINMEVSGMSDPQRGSPDDQFIHIDDGDEVRHWSRLLQVTPEELKAAVCVAGNSAMQVRAYFKLRNQQSYTALRKVRMAQT